MLAELVINALGLLCLGLLLLYTAIVYNIGHLRGWRGAIRLYLAIAEGLQNERRNGKGSTPSNLGPVDDGGDRKNNGGAKG